MHDLAGLQHSSIGPQRCGPGRGVQARSKGGPDAISICLSLVEPLVEGLRAFDVGGDMRANVRQPEAEDDLQKTSRILCHLVKDSGHVVRCNKIHRAAAQGFCGERYTHRSFQACGYAQA